jgi:hypothetical protein
MKARDIAPSPRSTRRLNDDGEHVTSAGFERRAPPAEVFVRCPRMNEAAPESSLVAGLSVEVLQENRKVAYAARRAALASWETVGEREFHTRDRRIPPTRRMQ